MPSIHITPVGSYDTGALNEAFALGLSAIGQPPFRGCRVLVKPNLLRPSSPDSAVTTHPAVITALCDRLLDAGATVSIGDSPGIGSAERVLDRLGLTAYLRSRDIPIADFSRLERRTCPDPILFREFHLPAVLSEGDCIINVPKLKTHQMMTLTAAVKNLYGCIVGIEKVRRHLMSGENRDHFATLLIDLWRTIAPQLNILDAIVAMEGDGPSSGTPRTTGFMAFSDDALALDAVVAQLVGIDAGRIPVLAVARQHGLPQAVERHAVSGDAALRIEPPLALPSSLNTDFAMPRLLTRFVKRFILAYPHVGVLCTACGICASHCPADAITIKDRAVVDRRRCIRCWCCQELCDRKAVTARRSLF